MFVTARGPSAVVAGGGYSLVAEHGLQGARDSVVASHWLQSTGLEVVVHGLS